VSDVPDIQPQKALWFSSSMEMFIRVCNLKDRHLEGAIGQERQAARLTLLQADNPEPGDTWHDYVNPIYIALVKEALRRFLGVPFEDDLLRQAELAYQEYLPSKDEQEIYITLYPDDIDYLKECAALATHKDSLGKAT
jgi:hypothetical protein